ncbi:16S rRNA (guanine(966)-N(2))-methyltransferase RsmD [Phytomonospora endophytica]|uniref:16S rRNA (Guanine(966)-N(2))-methyltransferase RsmD n=1 Tax=Phytomonospora endophytica TaxID=714109 RepID=A0A841FMC0_9ACTN|nr:16S rRNA (guanine(966)-N(2))-methyltransferase RsmD [Phytomonospora endophytica]MBB6034692.1 16S rRNA (guanine(966)-N(2))-methyltransferase RsmD [Phytomonospora endophytica]GIG69107.1 DNA methylase [Phytomonospora endophytica]
MTRIIAGDMKGRRLQTPPGDRTRPTSDRVREALFGSLTSLLDFDGARVADLYAGSGAVGLEACSRGAGHVLLVESDARAARVIRANITALGVGDRVVLTTSSVRGALAAPPGEPYDLVFADPPYTLDNAEVTADLAALVEGGWLHEDSLVLVERSTRTKAFAWPETLTETRGRRYGESIIWYGARS